MMRVSTFIYLLLFCLSAAVVKADIIDFETLPGGVPTDDLPISTQYLGDFGVTFGLDTDGDGFADPGQYPIMEAQGADGTDGFNNDTLGLRDTAAPGFEGDLGQFFLRGTAPVPPIGLVVLYANPVSGANGDIWDIDGNGSQDSEQWLVQGMGQDYIDHGDLGDVVATDLSPVGTDLTLDGKPWTFSLNSGSPNIYAIRITFTGTKTHGIGLAFDRFSPSLGDPTPTRRTSWGTIKSLYLN
jgi:hypothetical protein